MFFKKFKKSASVFLLLILSIPTTTFAYSDYIIPGGENTEDQAISNFTFEQIEEDMKESEKQIMELFSAGYKQMEIAAIMNCSQPQVSRIKAKIIKKMRKCS